MKKIRICFILLFILHASSSWSLSPTHLAGSLSNSFLFIENNIDAEYFISPASLEPRFSGSNKWVKYATRQSSLGYMGVTNSVLSTIYRHTDIWVDDSPIKNPFRGLRCTKGENCPENGYIQPKVSDQYGFYDAESSYVGSGGGNYGYATLSDSAYEYFRSMSVGSSKTFMFNFCRTSNSYNPGSGGRCKEQSAGRWYQAPLAIKKDAHLSLNAENIIQNIWIASDGTPSVGRDNSYCVLGSGSRRSGVICKVLSYKLASSDSSAYRNLYVSMVLNTSLGSVNSSYVQFSGDGMKWNNSSDITVSFADVFSASGKYVYVFLSKDFLKKYAQSGESVSDLFTLAFRNRILSESGYYEFTPSIRISIIPRNYGISIVSSGNKNSASGTGVIGSSTPIELSYTVTISAPRQADSVIAQVSGKKTIINTVPYCLFTSAQGSFSVPVPALLQYTSQSGGISSKPSGCQEEPVSLTEALWRKVPWDANGYDGGNFYSTDLKLVFPMDDPRSKLTDSGSEWQGVVTASGEIKVSAKWLGVDR